MLKQELSDKKHLVIYKASAGSGKTHRLTAEYLLLLFSSPMAYRHILAVTFTNKATEEMKSRIIQELAKLAKGDKSDYIEELCRECNKQEEAIREQARKVLTSILHDYSAFSISTIDRFFQQTMRAFTREIGLGGGYNVELDTNKVLAEAIDSMLYDLERSENKQLLDWLIRFSEEKIENGETWNIRSDIQSLSSEIFKESYKAFSDEIQADISDKGLLDDYKATLIKIIRDYEKRSQELGEKALNIMTNYQLKPEDFKGGARSTFFNCLKWANGEIKEPNDTFRKLPDDISAWYTKTTLAEIKSRIEEAFGNGLNDCVCDIIDHYDNSIIYQTAYEVNRYFFALGILGDVDKKIREYAAENNMMLISDTTELLNKIIQGSDSPFVYEKIGSRIDHYMIDEFQDTSGMQWSNFSPLVKDSLSAGNRNLIVGDVKQSIYRWRNSDWKLLDEQVGIDFGAEKIDQQSLDTNWRSYRNIIDFNNFIFETAPFLLQELFNENLLEEVMGRSLEPFRSRIKKAYGESYQYLPEKEKKDLDEGHVKIEFIDTEENPNWQAYVLEQLPVVIEELQDRGYPLKDIAILVRTKKEGAEVANRLLEYKGNSVNSKYRYDIISDEALFIKNSKSIKLVISLLKYLHNSSDNTLRTLAVYEYQKFKNQLTAEDAIRSHFSLNEEFSEEISEELERIKELSLYEMTEEIFDLFKGAMEDNENIYIQAFLDMVLDFTIKKSSDLDLFLKWWEERGQNQTIYTPDGQDAIRIMTIHKSKGLGFKVVLMPFCNWEIDHRLTTILWCQPKIEPFNNLKLVPVKYSQKLQNTIFAYEYFDEKLHAYIDNLNILYVAFTRAKEELIVFSPKPKDRVKGINSVSSLLWSCMFSFSPVIENKNFIELNEYLDKETFVFELGGNFNKKREEKEKTGNEITINSLPNISFEERLKLKLSNKYFFSEKGQREYGTLMHEIISKIVYLDDVEKTVQKYRLAGEITAQEYTEITDLFNQYLSDPQIAEWYSTDYRVLSEVQILQPNGKFIRPDRVMIKNGEVIVIDYKFGEKEEKKYHRQIKNYMAQIKKMGYETIRGYLCYISLNKTIEVNL
ncbi:MAG: UvrD-helicase domain-containing protein [Dysgonomonas sp.]|nr:UvrD-helicase domain-containing protein [Dysgonomonas sp.]